MKVRKQKNVKCESESSPKKTTKKASKKQKTAKGSSTGITRQDSGFTRVIKDLSIRFDSSFRNAERKSESLPKKTIQKAQETVEQSSTVPDRCITRQVSDPTRTRDYKDDIRILNATFIPASNENEVIPAVETTNFLRTYIMQNITCVTLERCDFDVGNINSDGHVKTFFYKLHQVVMNAGLDVGMKESKTDSLVTHLLYRAIDFDNWPLAVKVKEKYKIKVSDKKIMAIAEFVIEKQGVAMTIIVEHLENVDVTTDFGEAQILAKILAVANVNTKEKVTNQTLFTVRVISTYVTFYKATISKAYLKEIRKGLPKRRSIEIQRWPGQNGLRTGFDFASPKGRQAVLTALARI
ncbi:3607_t:CDS:2 [Rhizophagus irregularis]|nr:3607_t:CDS:2 [Rhizophagus irregularis]